MDIGHIDWDCSPLYFLGYQRSINIYLFDPMHDIELVKFEDNHSSFIILQDTIAYSHQFPYFLCCFLFLPQMNSNCTCDSNVIQVGANVEALCN